MTTSRLLASALIAAATTIRAAPVGIVGEWSSYTNSLPHLQLPHVPILGNGHLGVALDSHSTSVSGGGAIGPGSANTLDIWLSTTSFWSCTSCGTVDPDKDVPACCSTLALGGVSIRLTPTFPTSAPLPRFAAEQRIASGVLFTSWTTGNGGVVETRTYMHPQLDVVVTNVSWAPRSKDPPTLSLNISTWLLGNGAIKGSWNTGTPAPSAAGCAAADGGAQEPCSASPGAAQLVFLARNASTVDASLMPITAALASGYLLGGGATVSGTSITSYTPGKPPAAPWEITTSITLPAGGGSWVAVVTAEAEGRGETQTGTAVPGALRLLASVLAAPQGNVAAAAAAWWSDYWAQSSISLPSLPDIEQFWFGAQYVLACASSSNAAIEPPGLYGPWVTADGPNWHGDYTLDYNQIAPYFGAFGSNHGAQVEASWGPLLAWANGPGHTKAQAQAALAHVSCPSEALYFACHLAPWGLMSLDPMTRYMTWNGHFAVLPFINHWEYTRNASFARDVTLPFLNGLNAWWGCYLNKTATGPGPSDYVYRDANAYNPDYEHEGQTVPNPQIALGFIYRTIRAQLDIAGALNVSVPAIVADILAHLPPFNTAVINYTVGNVSFAPLPDTRCHSDEQTWYNVPSAAACQALCAASQPACGIFSYCPPSGTHPPLGGCSGSGGEPAPNTCWGFDISVLSQCVTNSTGNAGWTSGVRNGSAPTLPATIWAAYQGASKAESDWFSLYPLWPTEVEEPMAPGAPLELAGIAQATSKVFSDFVNGRSVDLFASAVRAGYNASFPLSWQPSDVVAGLRGYLKSYFGPNLLPYAPGGGIENIGISRAVNEMLLQSYKLNASSQEYVLSLFPFWPADQPAAFTTLLGKGGFVVSASYNNATRAVDSPVNITAAYTLLDAPSVTVNIINPWPSGTVVNATCSGGGAAAAAAVEAVAGALNVRATMCGGSSSGDILSFLAPRGALCQLLRLS